MVPPGEAASSIMPTASTGGRPNVEHQTETQRGQQHQLADQRDDNSFGVLCHPAEIGGCQSQPRPNMMIPSATGNPMVVSDEPMRSVCWSLPVAGSTNRKRIPDRDLPAA